MAQPTPIGDETALTAVQFQPKITPRGSRSSAQQWRLECVNKVLAAYDEIKFSMSPATRRELCAYLRAGNWILSARAPSNHAVVRSLRGKKPSVGHGRLYFPHLLVVHAIWGPCSWVVKLLYEFSSHWGVLFGMDKLTFPKIEDPNREYLLFLGKTPAHARTQGQPTPLRNPRVMVDAPRRPRAMIPSRLSGVAVDRQPLKPVQSAAPQVARPPEPKEVQIDIKEEVRRLDFLLPERVAQAAKPDSTKTAQAQAQVQVQAGPCQPRKTT